GSWGWESGRAPRPARLRARTPAGGSSWRDPRTRTCWGHSHGTRANRVPGTGKPADGGPRAVGRSPRFHPCSRGGHVLAPASGARERPAVVLIGSGQSTPTPVQSHPTRPESTTPDRKKDR